MRSFVQDIRYGFRMLIESPTFTLVAVLTLAVGIAANTTVFSWIDTVLVRPLPGVASPSELAAFETVTPNGEHITTSYPDYRDYRDHLKLITGIAMSTPTALSVGEEDHAERVWGELVCGSFFNVLGVKPKLGRFFSAEESGDKQGGYPIAVIGYGFWSRRYNSDPGIIGRTIRVNRQRLTVIGVTPPEFRGSIPGLTFEIWAPVMMAPALNAMPDWMLRDRQTRNLLGIARLQPGVTLERARAEIAALARELARREPATNEGMSATVLPIWRGHFGAQGLLLEPLRILMSVCLLVLLIVCANVANLLLARITKRQREFGIRVALGAARLRLIRQFMTENLIMAALGAIAGAPVAAWMTRSLGYLLPPTQFPMVMDIALNGRILAFTVAACVTACLLSGIAPAVYLARADMGDTLKDGGRSATAGSHSRRLRGALVVAEMALALVAIIGAGLFARSFQIARQINPGFDANHVVVSHLYLATAGYKVPDRKLLCRRLRDRLQAHPGIAAVAYADYIPLGFDPGPWEDLQIAGYVKGIGENMKIYRNVVSPGYFKLLGIAMLEGRDFTDQDDLRSAPVMIVNESFVRRFFGGGYAIGRRVHGWGHWFTVIGVVKDSKAHTPNEPPKPYFYVPFEQVYRADLQIAYYVRAKGDSDAALQTLRAEVRAMDPNIGVFDAVPMNEYITAALFPQKVAASLLAALGAMALALAAVGLYSVVSYSVTQRTQEIGIRMALGARAGDVLALVVRQGMALAASGLAVGVAAAIAVTRVASTLLVNVSATDPLIFAAAAIFLAVVALAASYLPARRATRIDPNVALRWQ